MPHGTSHALYCFALGHPSQVQNPVWDIPLAHWWVGPLVPAGEKKNAFLGPFMHCFAWSIVIHGAVHWGFHPMVKWVHWGVFFFPSKPQYGYAGPRLNTAKRVLWPAFEYGTLACAQISKHGYVRPCSDIETWVRLPMLGYQNTGTFTYAQISKYGYI